jgi:Carboxypeptidase regulatory-like domain/TonB dependent receptor
MSLRYVRFGLFLSFVTFLILAFSWPVAAQITSEKGALRLTVTDPQGAAVSGAKVTVSSPIVASQTKTTTDDGSVVFALLEPGRYKVTIENQNFKRTVLSDVAVDVTEVTNLSVRLELGGVSTEITVSGEAVQTVNTTNATLGNVLNEGVLQSLPLATRNFTFLLALNAGTSAPLPNATQAGRGNATIFVAGQRGTANNLVVNGIDANDLGNNNFGNVPIPSPDSLEEFRVQTSLYDASQGKTSGGNINVLTRGGTNNYHGEAYEFFRNDVMNANSYFFNLNGTPRPVLKQNQFGGNFGGPIPKLRDTFFFGSYEGTRQINGVAGGVSTQFPVLPASRTQANIEQAFGLKSGSLDPVALKLLNAPGQYGGFLVPSGVGTPGQFGLFTFSRPLRYNEDQFNINADRNIGTKHRISERFFFSNQLTLNPLGGEDPTSTGSSLGSGLTTPLNNRFASIAWTYTISPNLVNDARFGYDRIHLSVTAAPTATLSSIGMTRFNQSAFSDIPVFNSLDIDPEFGGISTNFDQAATNNTFHFADTVSLTRGKHSFRAGAEYRRYDINLFNNFASRGAVITGSFNDFLTGNILEEFVGSGQTDRGFRARDVAAYFQDDWKVTKRLTLNLGVRYDYLGPSTDVKSRLGNFDPNLLDATTLANAGPGILNGFILPSSASFGAIKGTPGVSASTLLSNSPHNFSPRVGFAFDPWGDGKTSIRGGYGLYYVRISNQMLLQLITGEPFFQLSAVLFPGTPLSNPFPNLPLPGQFPIFSVPPQFTGFSPTTGRPRFNGSLLALNPFDRHLTTPYVGNYNFSIQRELPKHFSIEAGFIGSQGVHLIDGLQRNQARLANAANPIVVGGANGVPVTTITTNSIRDVNARAGVLGFSPGGGLNEVTELGHSTYNAFVFTVNRRAGNLFLQAAYTYSRSIDNYSGSATQDLGGGSGNGNALDLTGSRAVSNFDRPHRFQGTYVYDIPGFKTGAWRYALGNWSIGGLTTFQSGLPANITCASCPANIFGVSPGNTLPQVVGNLSRLMASGSPQNFTSTSVFNLGVLANTPVLPAGTVVSGLNALGGPGNQSFTIGPGGGAIFGNLGRNTVRGPRQQNWDLFLSKKFPLTEKYSLTFRSEFFNAFNHPNFAAPNTIFAGVDPKTNQFRGAFGQYSATVGNPRILQLALKFDF